MNHGLSMEKIRNEVRKGVFACEREEIIEIWKAFLTAKLMDFNLYSDCLNYVIETLNDHEMLAPLHSMLSKTERAEMEEKTITELYKLCLSLKDILLLLLETEFTEIYDTITAKELKKILLKNMLIKLYEDYK